LPAKAGGNIPLILLQKYGETVKIWQRMLFRKLEFLPLFFMVVVFATPGWANIASQEYIDNIIAALSSVASTGSYNDLTDKPTLGTAAAKDINEFATAGQGAKADTALQSIPIATTSVLGGIKPDGTTIKVASDGTIGAIFDVTMNSMRVTKTAYGPGNWQWTNDTVIGFPIALNETLLSLPTGNVFRISYSEGGSIELNFIKNLYEEPKADWNATSGSKLILNKPTLGTAAAANTTDFATAAQGALADSAIQPGDLAPVATSGSYADLSNKPSIPTTGTASGNVPTLGSAASITANVPAVFNTSGALVPHDSGALGTAAFTDSTAYATAAQGAKADTAIQPAGGTMTGVLIVPSPPLP